MGCKLTHFIRSFYYLFAESPVVELSFNALKYVVLRIGPRYKYECVGLPLVLCGSKLAYVEQTKYLGVMLVSSSSFRYQILPMF